MGFTQIARVGVVLAVAAFLAGCGPSTTQTEAEYRPLGNFRLGHNIVVAPDPQKGPLSREADIDFWRTELASAVTKRLKGYEGDKFYNIGISIDGYVLALPGVPIVFSPKSVLILSLTVWDDAAKTKLEEEPYQFSVFESLSGDTAIGSGLTQSKQEQMDNLNRNAAFKIHEYLADHPEWFGLPPLPKEDSAN